MVQNGTRMANGTHTTPPPHIFHTPWLFTTYLHDMSGWDWQWGEHGGRKANKPGGGGSKGGDGLLTFKSCLITRVVDV